MKPISSIEPKYRVGQVDDEIIQDAKNAGLSETGIEAMTKGNRKVFKMELEKLERTCPGNIWACTAGYALWFNSANEGEKRQDY